MSKILENLFAPLKRETVRKAPLEWASELEKNIENASIKVLDFYLDQSEKFLSHSYAASDVVLGKSRWILGLMIGAIPIFVSLAVTDYGNSQYIRFGSYLFIAIVFSFAAIFFASIILTRSYFHPGGEPHEMKVGLVISTNPVIVNNEENQIISELNQERVAKVARIIEYQNSIDSNKEIGISLSLRFNWAIYLIIGSVFLWSIAYIVSGFIDCPTPVPNPSS